MEFGRARSQRKKLFTPIETEGRVFELVRTFRSELLLRISPDPTYTRSPVRPLAGPPPLNHKWKRLERHGVPLLPRAHERHHLLGFPVPDVRDDSQRVEALEEEVAAESLPPVPPPSLRAVPRRTRRVTPPFSLPCSGPGVDCPTP